MTVTKVILISAATSLVLVVLLISVGWGVARHHLAGAHGGLMQAHHMRGLWFSAPSRHGSHGGMRGGGHARACERLSSAHVEGHVDDAKGWVAAELDLTEVQRGALDPVLGAATGWVTGLRELCAARPDSAPETVRLLGDLTSRGDAATQELVAAFDGFYATLDQRQRSTVDDWLRWPHGHHAVGGQHRAVGGQP